MIQREGYKADFLGNAVVVPMPEIGLEHQNDVLCLSSGEDPARIDYLHYTVKMSKSNRQAFFSAANIDQKKFQLDIQSREWFLDPRIGYENQVGEDAYTKNCWDRGHLTRRADVTWGEAFEAKNASNDSCCYANACPQHENFNQDEWTVPEGIIFDFDKDYNDKLCVFTGPVFTTTDRWYTRIGLDRPVRIPSAFWKVVAYIDKGSKALACQAFLMYQDSLFIKDKRGKEKIDIRNYQVTITEIERLTGLVFPPELFEKNPLYFYPREGINDGPEAYLTPTKKEREKTPKTGIVFTREDTKTEDMKKRKRTIPYAAFNDFVNRTR